MRGILFTLLFALVVAGAAATTASGSELIDRNTKNVRLRVNGEGVALLTYTARGHARRVFAWGAINALAPTTARPQVGFQLDYSGSHFPNFRGTCARYDGPPLKWLVAACKAPDGSYWAVQQWRRLLPLFGRAPRKGEAARELRLSHWTGPLALLVIKMDWSYGGRFDHLYGRMTYRDKAVHGFRSTSQGSPLDTYGRNVYMDTLNSGYGRGWKREMGILTHNPNGNFCYDFVPRNGHSSKGEAYRATAIGPGVTPDVFAQRKAPGPFDVALDRAANQEQVLFSNGDRLCRPT